MWLARAALVLIATVLTACASGPRTIDAEVRTNAAQPPGHAVLQGAHYRFERGQLVAGQPDPAKLEAMAQTALARVGAVRDDAQPRVSVQVGGYVSAYWMDDSYYGGLSNPRIALGMGVGRGGFGFGMGWPLSDPSIPAYVSEVNLLMRDLDEAIMALEITGRPDQLTLRRLKKQKLALKDQIVKLEDRLIPDIIA